MTAVNKIKSVLSSRVLVPALIIVPARGAMEDEILEEEAMLGAKFCADHCAILQQWNGIDLEVIRFFGCGPSAHKIGRLAHSQIESQFVGDLEIVVGSDVAGLMYVQSPSGTVWTFDTDGGGRERLADSLDDLIERLVFGWDAASFAGQEWLVELRNAGLV